MKAISIGNRFVIYDDTLKTYDELPAGTYIVRFDKMQGFFLEEYAEIEVKEDKIYGVHYEKVKKVLESFGRFERNLGVILSGNKGIGKSLFAKLLSLEAINRDLPLIIVDKFIPGVASFIEQIEQEVVVLFDEFDKTFGNIRTSDNEVDPQAGLLTLFDGISQGKKLFVITCNDLRSLNDYLINRPGRFHYHFRFEYPTPQEIREYLQDKLSKEYYEEIDKVVAFSRKVNLNYDCLRAIAFELNFGVSFEDAIQDLNIINTQSFRYNVVLHFKDGSTMSAKGRNLDLFNQDDDESVDLCDQEGRNIIKVIFNPLHCKYENCGNGIIVTAEHLSLIYDEYGYYEKEIVEKAKKLKPDYLSIIRCREKDIHYAA